MLTLSNLLKLAPLAAVVALGLAPTADAAIIIAGDTTASVIATIGRNSALDSPGRVTAEPDTGTSGVLLSSATTLAGPIIPATTLSISATSASSLDLQNTNALTASSSISLGLLTGGQGNYISSGETRSAVGIRVDVATDYVLEGFFSSANTAANWQLSLTQMPAISSTDESGEFTGSGTFSRTGTLVPNVDYFLSTTSAAAIIGGESIPGDNFAAAASSIQATLTLIPEPLGDYNGDGFVSQADLDLVLLNWGESEVPAGWVATDQFDGVQVSQNELDNVLLNWGVGTPPTVAAIPEPTSLSVLALSGTLLATRRRRST